MMRSSETRKRDQKGFRNLLRGRRRKVISSLESRKMAFFQKYRGWFVLLWLGIVIRACYTSHDTTYGAILGFMLALNLSMYCEGK